MRSSAVRDGHPRSFIVFSASVHTMTRHLLSALMLSLSAVAHNDRWRTLLITGEHGWTRSLVEAVMTTTVYAGEEPAHESSAAGNW